MSTFARVLVVALYFGGLILGCAVVSRESDSSFAAYCALVLVHVSGLLCGYFRGVGDGRADR